MLRLSNLFGDHGILQRQMPIPVWGWTSPRTLVTVRLGESASAVGISGDDGKFLLRLPAQEAGGPCTLRAETETEYVETKDLYIGEVWLAGGQSNMEMPLKGFRLPVFDRDKLTFAIPVRMLTVPREVRFGRVHEVSANWTLPTPEALDNWSAAGAFFAAELSHQLNVPIGIISSNWGGTVAEAWISRETLHANPAFTAAIDAYERNIAKPEYWAMLDELDILNRPMLDQEQVLLAILRKQIPEYPADTGFSQGWAGPDFNDSEWETMDLPGSWKAQGGHQTNGAFWFRRQITIPASWVGRPLTLGIGAADKHDVTYVNGIQVGATGTDFEIQYWDTLRSYPVPADVVQSTKLTLAVRVYSFMGDGGLNGPAAAMKAAPADAPQEAIAISGIWRYRQELALDAFFPLMGVNNSNVFSSLYDNMIYPLLPYALRGAIWYQGESNAANPQLYEQLMIDLIRDWRYHWGQSEFAFLQVLLAGFQLKTNSSWPDIREAQVNAANATGTGFAGAVDVGDADDIHPREKRTVGTRLALRALHDVYGFTVTAHGPTFRRTECHDSRVKVTFDHDGGLYAENGSPGGWEIAGPDGKYYPAAACIDGSGIIVSAREVADPHWIRYAWRENPREANLYNLAHLPMIPFRVRLK